MKIVQLRCSTVQTCITMMIIYCHLSRTSQNGNSIHRPKMSTKDLQDTRPGHRRQNSVRIFVRSKEQHRTHRSFQNGQLEIMCTLSSVTRICRGDGADSVWKKTVPTEDFLEVKTGRTGHVGVRICRQWLKKFWTLIVKWRFHWRTGKTQFVHFTDSDFCKWRFKFRERWHFILQESTIRLVSLQLQQQSKVM